ncbi:glycosyltransferase, partial [Vibrio parahaemolyticus]
REDVTQLDEPAQRMQEREGPIRILVMGGSQGARILNQTLPAVMANLGQDYSIRHQAGKGAAQEVQAAYQA